MAIRHHLDRTGRAASLGYHAEAHFKNVAQRQGYKITEATKHQDIYEHWDFLLEKDGQSFKVEVKAQKGFAVKDRGGVLTKDFFLVEFTGVTGHAGWVEGKADLVALGYKDGFYLVSRELLAKISRAKHSRNWVDKKEDMLYSSYGRRDRNDEVTAILISDVTATKRFLWWD